jgi:hypothetical protein
LPVRARLRALVGSLPAVRTWTPSTWLLATGLGLWFVAQALPAAVTRESLGEDPGRLIGFDFTVFGFLPAALSLVFGLTAGVVAEAAAGVLGLIGWLANIFLAAMLILRERGVRASRAMACSIAGLVCAVAGVAALHLSPSITSVEAGTWIWLASFAVIPLAMARWRLVERGRDARPGIEPVPRSQVGQLSAVDIAMLEPTGLGAGLLLAVLLGFCLAVRGILALGGVVGLGILILAGAAVAVWVFWPQHDDGESTPPATDSGLPRRHH